jgi:phosphoenolpyruvate carboxylase
MAKKDLPEALRSIVKTSVAVLGEVIERELGRDAYLRIEGIRKKMASVRTASSGRTTQELDAVYRDLKKRSAKERLDIAVAYTLMLETMNACENAYRTFRLRERNEHPVLHESDIPLLSNPDVTPITYVLTAHPTESRSSKNIAIFYEIQKFLVRTLERGGKLDRSELKSLLEIAWRVPIVRSRKPSVEDEAEHLYSVALREENLETILRLSRKETPIYLRSWVGGDKDGHPGVDEVALVNSLQASRRDLNWYARKQLDELGDLLDLFQAPSIQKIRIELKEILSGLREVSKNDGARMKKLHQGVLKLKRHYESKMGEIPEPIRRLEQMLHTFPGLVIPLELREDSGMIMQALTAKKKFAIERMLLKVAEISKGGNPRWYAQGFIISMCQSIEHIEAAADLLTRTLGALKIRVIPLFEQKEALHQSSNIIETMLKRPRFKKALKGDWLNRVEVMLGYSDSSKEAGVFPSRIEVSGTMRLLDQVCKKFNVQPIYFHGSGGSVDRGGGPVEEQLASWSKGALAFYKATIQGEMVERSFASPEIAESQFLKIAETAQRLRKSGDLPKISSHLNDFSAKIEASYRAAVSSERFMTMVESATPYRFLSALKIGSRPAKRASSKKGALAVTSLRAIPWVLCWTQTRVLFPTWWGTGSAWSQSNRAQQQALKDAYENHALFRSFVHVLGFTLSKIELPVFNFYLDQSNLPAGEKVYFKKLFEHEYRDTLKFFADLTGEKDPLWFRPWLSQSIVLRSAMIHPLNLLQILAEQEHDLPLLRVAVTGVASGMLTTG